MRLTQMLEPDNWDLRQAKKLCGLEPTMSGYDAVAAVYQNGGIEPEGLDAASDRPDLLATMDLRIERVRHKRTDWRVSNGRTCGGDGALPCYTW